MGRYAKIIATTGEVLDVQNHPIQLLDEERGVFEVVELDLEPLDGLRPGDHVERRPPHTPEDDAAFEAAINDPTTAVPAADDEVTSDEHEGVVGADGEDPAA